MYFDIYTFLNFILYLEILLLSFCLITLVVGRMSHLVFNPIFANIREKIARDIVLCLQKKKSVSQFKMVNRLSLIEVLETFNLKLSDADWDELKIAIAAKYILPKARKWGRSMFWRKRQLAARSFALAALPQDENTILHLMEDSSFLVRSLATAAVIKMESKKGLVKALVNMTKEVGYAHYFYLDLLSRSPRQIFTWVAEMASERRAWHLACLEILGTQTLSMPMPFLEEDLHSRNPQFRKAAFRVLLCNSHKGNVSNFIEGLDDPDEEIQTISAKGLGNHPTQQSIKALRKAIQQKSWPVRLEAARSLNKMGELELIDDSNLKEYIINFG